MKIKIAAILTALVLLTGACKYFKHNTDATTTVVNYPMLDSVSVFNYPVVVNFFPSPEAIVYARKLYLNAIDLFVNKKNGKESLPLFLQSLRIAPQAFPYYNYAEALYACEDYTRADKAYGISRALDETIKADAMMGSARCHAIMGDTSQMLSCLVDALAGYQHETEAITGDKAFEKYKDLEGFKILLVKYTQTDVDQVQALFALFIKNFHTAAFPYSIPPDSVAVHSGRQIDFRYADFVPGMKDGAFSRSVERDYQYMTALSVPGDFKTFVYRSVDFNGDTLYPVHQYIMTISQDDTVIASQEIACACTPLTIKTATVDSSGFIEVKEIMQTWKDDPRENGYTNNEVTKQEVKATTFYQIGTDGKITETKARPASGPAQADNTAKQ